ncbi:DUF2933 domain-containing protein [Streptomyces sp. YIM S03343]
MKHINKNVLIGGAVVVAALLALRPGWIAGAFPLLLLALCPLSMIFMMRGMHGAASGRSTGAGSGSGTPQPQLHKASADSDLHRQIADLQEEVRILRATTTTRRRTTDDAPPQS